MANHHRLKDNWYTRLKLTGVTWNCLLSTRVVKKKQRQTKNKEAFSTIRRRFRCCIQGELWNYNQIQSFYLNLMITSAQVIKLPVTVTNSIPPQDYPHTDDRLNTTVFIEVYNSLEYPAISSNMYTCVPLKNAGQLTFLVSKAFSKSSLPVILRNYWKRGSPIINTKTWVDQDPGRPWLAILAVSMIECGLAISRLMSLILSFSLR